MSRARMVADDSGASSVEYGLIVFAIAAAVVSAVFALGGATEGLFVNSCDTIASKATESGAPCS